MNLYWRQTDGTGDEQRLTESKNAQYPALSMPGVWSVTNASNPHSFVPCDARTDPRRGVDCHSEMSRAPEAAEAFQYRMAESCDGGRSRSELEARLHLDSPVACSGSRRVGVCKRRGAPEKR